MSYFGLADMLDNVVRRLQGPHTDLVLPEVDLTGSVAVLTGASTVTGQEMVRALARRGAKVIVAARNVEDVKAAAEGIDLQNIDDAFVHLTNNAVQKHAVNYGDFEDGNQLSFPAF